VSQGGHEQEDGHSPGEADVEERFDGGATLAGRPLHEGGDHRQGEVVGEDEDDHTLSEVQQSHQEVVEAETIPLRAVSMSAMIFLRSRGS
jgi:hypothetical protein